MLRGTNKQRIFEFPEDYERFLGMLAEVKEATGLTLYAYCLLSNHAHLLLKESAEPLPRVFSRLATRYAGWFNQKYERTGHLFQDRFRSEPVESDAYFLAVLAYIFQNPVAAGLCREPQDYEWSSRRFLGGGSGLIDYPELHAIVPDSEAGFSERPFIGGRKHEPMAPRRRAYTDEDVMGMVARLCGKESTSECLRLSIEGQRALAAGLREEKVPIRQISRVTGISKGVLERWGKA